MMSTGASVFKQQFNTQNSDMGLTFSVIPDQESTRTENFGLRNELLKRESLASVEVAGESIMDESISQEYEEKPVLNYGKHDRSI